MFDGTRLDYYETARDLAEAMFSPDRAGYIYVIHNLEYDIRYLFAYFDELRHRGYHIDYVTRADKKFLAVRITSPNKMQWEIRDTYALFAAPLRALSVFAGEEKHTIDIENFDPTNPEHREYLAADVRILYKAYQRYREIMFDLYQIEPGYTAGSTAVKAMARNLPRDIFRQNRYVEEFARKSYYGGLCFVRFARSFEDATQLDARGMYGWAMKQPLPLGHGIKTARYRDNKLGIYRCTVKSPRKVPFTFVPYRLKDGVAWPYGTFETYLPSVTIELACFYGYDIIVHEGYFFPESAPILEPFITQIESLERENKGNAIGAAVKILRNSGYGKFAEKASKEMLTYDLTKPGVIPLINEDTGEMLDIGIGTQESEAGYMHIEWAAFITAYARLNLVDAIYQIDPDRVIIGDTDSMTIIGDYPQNLIGGNYGQYKVEREYQFIIPHAPKTYAGKDKSGKEVIKCKGIPIQYLGIEDIKDGGKASFTSVISAWRVLTGKPFAQTIERSVSRLANSKAWVQDHDRVLPITIG
jgi:hypothetical protein